MRGGLAWIVVLALVFTWTSGAAAVTRQVPPMLVYERGGDLYRMTLDGSETVRLRTTKQPESGPAVSPEGLRIAFTRRNDELWLMNANGGEQRRLLAARPRSVRYASTGSPSWAPDGNTIYFNRSAQGPNEICGWIYRIGADGRGLRKVTRGVTLDFEPAVSPDGRRIGFITGECEPGLDCCYLTVVDLAGRATKDLSKLPPATPDIQYNPSWAPDGNQIAFEGRAYDGPGSIYVANRDGSSLRRVTPEGLYAHDPAWSPDGEWIAFAAETMTRSSDLYVVRTDGTGLRRLTQTSADECAPAWLLRT
jgi:TolB protein